MAQPPKEAPLQDVGVWGVSRKQESHPQTRFFGCGKRNPFGCGSKPMGCHFGVGAPPILEPILVEIESDVHWGYDLDFGPWPNEFI